VIKIFLDTADIKEIEKWSKDSLISGYTTNPSLAKKSGIKNYRDFMKTVLDIVGDEKPVSFEVLSNNREEIREQAFIISEFGKNVYVKIPIKNTDGEYLIGLIQSLSKRINLNITAIMSVDQVRISSECLLYNNNKYILSMFAGRIADCGHNPRLAIAGAKREIEKHSLKNIELLWASTREAYNIHDADTNHADIITCTPQILDKFIKLRNKNLEEYSVETAQMFYNDAIESGLSL